MRISTSRTRYLSSKVASFSSLASESVAPKSTDTPLISESPSRVFCVIGGPKGNTGRQPSVIGGQQVGTASLIALSRVTSRAAKHLSSSRTRRSSGWEASPSFRVRTLPSLRTFCVAAFITFTHLMATYSSGVSVSVSAIAGSGAWLQPLRNAAEHAESASLLPHLRSRLLVHCKPHHRVRSRPWEVFGIE